MGIAVRAGRCEEVFGSNSPRIFSVAGGIAEAHQVSLLDIAEELAPTAAGIASLHLVEHVACRWRQLEVLLTQ
jgi:hypothetical protein